MSDSTTAAQHRARAERFDQIVRAVPADSWSNPSPCEGWTAADVLDHVVTSLEEFLARHDLAGDGGGGDRIERWAAVRQRMQEVLDDPSLAGMSFDGFFGPTTVQETVDAFYVPDLLIHGWDLARAAGLTELEPMDPHAMADAWQAFAQLPEKAMRSDAALGQAVQAPPGADLQTAFLAFTGRTA